MKNYNHPPTLSNATGTGPWKEGDAFSGVMTDYYWSSTAYASNTNRAWYMNLFNGFVFSRSKAIARYVWPVRGGQ
jgi:hypothetical protein